MDRECASVCLARVDLDSMAVSVEDISSLGSRFLGGRGVNYFLLLRELSKGIRALEKENKVVFGTGLLVGTAAPGANRTSVACLSPLTKGLGAGSAGGGFSIELRAAGFDHILLESKAKSPIYILITDNNIEIRDAGFLWNRDTRETVELLRDVIQDEKLQVACIGPAGENLCLNSCVMFTQGRAVGRCGIGAVLGSKNVKAIAVRGTGRITVEDSLFNALANKWANIAKDSKALQDLAKVGTVSCGTVERNPYRVTPSKNFQYSEPAKRFHIEEFEAFHTSTVGVSGCPISCAQRYEVCSGKYEGTFVDKFEGNSRANFGARVALEDAAAVLRAHELCQLLGLDVDNTSGTIAWAMECYQRGILNRDDTDGMELDWGNDDVVMKLIGKCAKREGFGDLLADGCKIAAEKLGRGSEKFCIHVKGQPLFEAQRPYKGWALGVLVSERGGGHTRGAPMTEFESREPDSNKKIWSREVSERLFGIPNAGDPTSYKNKPQLVVYYERLHAILDSIGVCYFMSNWVEPDLLSPKDIAALVSRARGEKISTNSLMETGEKIVALGKIFNQVHAGFGREDDYPPDRLMREPIEGGPYRGEKLEKVTWDQMLTDYYRIHGWDINNGQLTCSTLRKLGLDDLTNLLESR